MPDTTPTFGIPYPCMNEVVSASDFADFAAGVEDAIASVDVTVDQALNPPNVGVNLTQSVAVNVATDCVYTTEYWDTANMAAVTTTPLTVPENGMYLITINAGVTGFATITSSKAAININGTDQFAFKFPAGQGTPNRNCAQGLYRLAATDLVRCRFTWTGTGGPGTVTGPFSMVLVSRQF